MALMPHQIEEAQKTAQHEFGHFVIARVLGFQTGEVTLTLTNIVDGHRATAAIYPARSTPRLEDVQRYLEHRISVLMAGSVAQTLNHRLHGSQVDRTTAIQAFTNPGPDRETDILKVQPLLYILRNIEFASESDVSRPALESQIQTIQDRIWEETIRLVEAHEDAIVSLGRVLAGKIIQVGMTATMSKADLEELEGVKALSAQKS